jgi:hypothetical protein
MVQAVDRKLNREALGARITVVAGGRAFARTIRRASSYLSSNDAPAHFGLGQIERIDHIDVRWPDGSRERFRGGGVDRFLTVERGQGENLP